MIAATAIVSARCLACWRPHALCWCRDLPAIATRTRVVFLQHPRERTMKTGTARLARAGLAHAELHVGVRFDEHPRLVALAGEPRGRVVLLYPGPDAAPIDTLDEPPRTLVVIDGTWSTARKMLARNALLRTLPRVALRPARPSAYRIRREPAAHCLSTVEAVVAALTGLEGDGARFAPLLAAFDRLVETQVRYASTRRVPYQHERKQRRPRRASVAEDVLATRFADVVLVQAEGNPRPSGPHELVHLVALRPASGERFATVVRPRHTVGPHIPSRLGLDPATLDAGTSVTALGEAWAAFLRPGDVLAGWGGFTPTMLDTARLPRPAWLDLRAEVARRLGRSPGGIEGACHALAAPPLPAWAPGRAGGRIAALARLVEQLRAPHRPTAVPRDDDVPFPNATSRATTTA